jgi:transposase InsO family protein
LVHLDTKKLGRIRGLGHRITGQRTHRTRGIGWEFLHIAIDDYSRAAYMELLADERGTTMSAFLRRALRWFRARGVPVRRILTDNGSGYLSRSFRATCRELQLVHRRTRPYTPRTNGKAERFIQTALREWAYRRPYYTSFDRRRRQAVRHRSTAMSCEGRRVDVAHDGALAMVRGKGAPGEASPHHSSAQLNESRCHEPHDFARASQGAVDAPHLRMGRPSRGGVHRVGSRSLA